MTEAARFLRDATPHHDRWFLFVDEFDPHEPFDTPPPWVGRYEDEPWDEEWIIWPPYANGAISRGNLTEREGRHIRANYGSKLSMIDHWFGRILDAFDEGGLWDDTVLVVCTDHGHYLGDERDGRDVWGKPNVPQFEPIGHTPLLVAWPGRTGGGTCDALTTNVDLFATVADLYGVTVEHRTHGRSLVPLLTGEADSVRDWAIGGMYGRWVQVTDGTTKYARSSSGDNFPLSMWSNRWSTMPVNIGGFNELPAPDERAVLDHMPGTTVPVIRQPFRPGDLLPFWVAGADSDRHHLYNLDVDPDEQENRVASGWRLRCWTCCTRRSGTWRRPTSSSNAWESPDGDQSFLSEGRPVAVQASMISVRWPLSMSWTKPATSWRSDRYGVSRMRWRSARSVSTWSSMAKNSIPAPVTSSSSALDIPARPQRVCCITTTEVTPMVWLDRARLRRTSSVTRPPALRITWASPRSRPSAANTSMRASMQVTTARCRLGSASAIPRWSST